MSSNRRNYNVIWVGSKNSVQVVLRVSVGFVRGIFKNFVKFIRRIYSQTLFSGKKTKESSVPENFSVTMLNN